MRKTHAGLIATLALTLVFLSVLILQRAFVRDQNQDTDQNHGQDFAQDDEFLGLLDFRRAGMPAPKISFLNETGHTVSLRDYRGSTLVVNFWATWCAPCLAEMPALDQLNETMFVEGGKVIAINTDFTSEAATFWLQENKIQSLALFYDDRGEAFFDAGGTGLPYSLILDPDGFIVAEVFGEAPWDTPAATAFVLGLGEDNRS